MIRSPKTYLIIQKVQHYVRTTEFRGLSCGYNSAARMVGFWVDNALFPSDSGVITAPWEARARIEWANVWTHTPATSQLSFIPHRCDGRSPVVLMSVDG